MSELATTSLDKPATANPELAAKLSARYEPTAGATPQTGKRGSDTEVQAGTIPALDLYGLDRSNTRWRSGAMDAAAADRTAGASSESHWYSGALNVASDLVTGGIDEALNHPARVLAYAAGGAAMVLAAPYVAAAAAAVGITEGALTYGAFAGGVVYAAGQTHEHGGELAHDAGVVANPESYTPAEQQSAHEALHNVGAGIMDLAAGATGSLVADVARAALASRAVNVTAGAEAALEPATVPPATVQPLE
jgi:hypothetical protein